MNKIVVKNNILLVIISFFVGIIFTYLLLPNLLLHPNSLNLSGDALQHAIGWEFLRNDNWNWPLTYTHNLMYPFGISIVFTDSFPLLSIILKLFRNILPEPFIWHGTVCVINTSLLFYFSVKLFMLRINDYVICLLGGMIGICSSVFILRLSGHFTLTSQWLLIAEMILIFDSRLKLSRVILFNAILLFVATGTHAYFVPMLLSLNVGLLWRMYVDKQVKIKHAIALFILFLIVVVISAYCFGYFSSHSNGQAWGFGYYSNNILSLINSQHGSLIFKSIEVGAGQDEGFAYLGLGNIILLIFVLINKRYWSFKRKYIFYYLILLLFFFYGLSNVWMLGTKSIISFSVPSGLFDKLTSTFRASGRFIWSVYYFIQFWVLSCFCNDYIGGKSKKRVIIFIILLLQITDNSFLFKQVRNLWLDNRQLSQDPSYIDVTRFIHDNKLKVEHFVVYVTQDDILMQLGRSAIENHSTLNNFYVARPGEIYDKMNYDILKSISNGMDINTLYIFDRLNFALYRQNGLRDCYELNNLIMCSNAISSSKVGSIFNINDNIELQTDVTHQGT